MRISLSQLDLQAILLFQAVARSASFTRAGQEFGLTQSAVTRQIQHLEQTVGTPLMIRTTRSVRLTEAGEDFLATATRITRDLEESLDRFSASYLDQPPRVTLGMSHSIAHSHLPGLIAHFRRTNPQARISIVYDSGDIIREKLQDHQIDVAIFTRLSKQPPKLRLLHSFRDDFVIITPGSRAAPGAPAIDHTWLALDHRSTTGTLLREWISASHPDLTPAIELPSFDLIINLVALGIGSSIVPRRALRLYGHRLQVTQVEPKNPLYREVGVYSRKSATLNPIIEQFVKSILFDWKAQEQTRS